MAKRQVRDYAPVGLAPALKRPYVSREDLEALAAIAGGYPDRLITVEQFGPTPDTNRLADIPARCAFAIYAQRAATAYHVMAELNEKPTPLQIAEALTGIETAARRLMLALNLKPPLPEWVEATKVLPLVLQSTLGGQASLEAMQSVPRTNMGAELLRDAVVGVDRLRRWSEAAHKAMELPPADAPKKGRGKIEANEALDSLVRSLVEDCWERVFAREANQGGALLYFLERGCRAAGVRFIDRNGIRARLRKYLKTLTVAKSASV